jgi:hypothetical protein
MTPEEILAGLESCAISPGRFHHEEHVAAAWEALRRMPLGHAAERISGALRRFAARAGVPDRYHETVTWAFVVLIAERRRRIGLDASWPQFRAAFPELFSCDLLARYYSPELLASDLARTTFVLPDPGLPQPSDLQSFNEGG